MTLFDTPYADFEEINPEPLIRDIPADKIGNENGQIRSLY